ncbi:MAG: ParM/StbA family protein [Cyanobacteria bacterium P01_D01_bin.56]
MPTQTAQNRQLLPHFGQLLPSKPTPMGLDVGNSATKALIGNEQTSIPSYVQPIYNKLHQLPAEGFVRYVAGNYVELHGRCWLAGKAAYQRNPEAYLRVCDDKQAKITQALPLVLGALSYLPFQELWDLRVVASIHHAREMGGALKQALEGTHTVQLNDHSDPTHVSITVLKVLDEGAGAVATAGLTNGQNLIYDFGGGTTIISVFGEKGRLINRQVSPGGANALIDEIATNPDVIRRESGEADRETIRRGIENGTFAYGLQSPWDMEPIYQQEVRPWMSTVLRTALKAGDKWQRNCNRVIAIGGGAQLPLVAEVLEKKGIETLADSAWANARGLKQIATLLLEAQDNSCD